MFIFQGVNPNFFLKFLLFRVGNEITPFCDTAKKGFAEFD